MLATDEVKRKNRTGDHIRVGENSEKRERAGWAGVLAANRQNVFNHSISVSSASVVMEERKKASRMQVVQMIYGYAKRVGRFPTLSRLDRMLTWMTNQLK